MAHLDASITSTPHNWLRRSDLNGDHTPSKGAALPLDHDGTILAGRSGYDPETDESESSVIPISPTANFLLKAGRV